MPVILFWLVQQRLPELRQLTPVAWWPGLLWAGAGAFCWLIGDAAGVALARHLGLIVMLQGAVIGVLGPQISRALAFPLFRSEEHTSELQSLMRISYAVFCLKKKTTI